MTKKYVVSDDKLYESLVKRQEFFTVFAKETYSAFIKLVSLVFAGVVALIAYKQITPEMESFLVYAIVFTSIFVVVTGYFSWQQIGFCLRRWYGYRKLEAQMTEGFVKAEEWAESFEKKYQHGVIVVVLLFLLGSASLLYVILSKQLC